MLSYGLGEKVVLTNEQIMANQNYIEQEYISHM